MAITIPPSVEQPRTERTGESLDAKIKRLRGEHRELRRGALNGVGGWVLDTFSSRGQSADRAVEAVVEALAVANKDGFISEEERKGLTALTDQAARGLADYRSLKVEAGGGVGVAAMVGVPLIAGALRKVSPLASLLLSATANVLAKATIEGRAYSKRQAAIDGVTGLVGGGVGIGVAKGLGAVVATRGLSGVGAQAVVGSGAGAAASAAASVVNPINWDEGFVEGTKRVAVNTVVGGVSGGALGAVASRLSAIEPKAPKPPPDPTLKLLGTSGRAAKTIEANEKVLLQSLLPSNQLGVEGSAAAWFETSKELSGRIDEGLRASLTLLGRSNHAALGGSLSKATERLTAIWQRPETQQLYLSEAALREHSGLTVQQYASKILLDLAQSHEREYLSDLPAPIRALLAQLEESPRIQAALLKSAHGSHAVAMATLRFVKFALVFGVGLGFINSSTGAFTGPLNEYGMLRINDGLRDYIAPWRKIWSPNFLNVETAKHAVDAVATWLESPELEAAVTDQKPSLGHTPDAIRSEQSLQNIYSPVLVDLFSLNNAYTGVQQAGRDIQIKRDSEAASIGLLRTAAEANIDRYSAQIAQKLATWTPPPPQALVDEYKQAFRLWSLATSDAYSRHRDPIVSSEQHANELLALQGKLMARGATRAQIDSLNDDLKLLWQAEATAATQMWAWVRLDLMFADTAGESANEELKSMYMRTNRDGAGFYPALTRHFETMKLLARGVPRLEEMLRHLEPMARPPLVPLVP